MNVVLLKDWGDLEKGSQVTINDESVLKEGFRVGLFQNPEDTPITTKVDDKTGNPDDKTEGKTKKK